MLTTATREIIKSTAPVLKEHGVTLTRHFYNRLFTHNPELKELFNQGHQRNGGQQEALAMAVVAYAENIDHPHVLQPVLERIAAKHVSLGIRKEHYSIVGKHLLASIREVLQEAASSALVEAWAAAYQQLADLLVELEQSIYDQAIQKSGGWTGWRSFKVTAKRRESLEITSFELTPADGGKVPHYLPGQYISVRSVIPELGYRQPRQYSLSNPPGEAHFQISVKREASTSTPSGMMSNHLHDHIQENDLIDVAPPTGDFFLHEDRQTPVVLISGGVGITPMISMLAHLNKLNSNRVVRFLHASRCADVQAFSQRIRTLIESMENARYWITHETKSSENLHSEPNAYGLMDLQKLNADEWLPPDADYYVCGPVAFMNAQINALKSMGISVEHIHAEIFGTGGVTR